MSYLIGGRDAEYAMWFMDDLRLRLAETLRVTPALAAGRWRNRLGDIADIAKLLEDDAEAKRPLQKGEVGVIAKDLLTWSAIVMFGVSALLWLASTHVKVSAAKVVANYQKIHGPGSGPAQIVSEDGSDFCATVERQSRWSRWAAFATAIALSLQAGATALSSN